MFAALSDKALGILQEDVQSVAVAPGEYFFQHGDPGNGMYVLESGHARIHLTWSDRSLLLGRVGPGDCFGEISLIDASPRSASVQADTSCTALRISSKGLQKLRLQELEQYVIVLENISREMCRRLRLSDVNRMMMARASAGNASTGTVDIELPWP